MASIDQSDWAGAGELSRARVGLISLLEAADMRGGMGPCAGDDGDFAPRLLTLLETVDAAGVFGPCVGDDSPIVDNPGVRDDVGPGRPMSLLDVLDAVGTLGPCIGDDGGIVDGIADQPAQPMSRSAERLAPLGPCVGDDLVVSDRRLKTDVTRIGATVLGLPLYRFSYTGKPGVYSGVMAQDVLEAAPDAVAQGPDGFYRVDYRALGISMHRLG